MSDPNSWQSPSGWQPTAPSLQPLAPPPPGGWAPPPKPGLIPLRPLTLGTLLGASFQVMRRNPRPTFGLALLLNAASLVLFGLVIAAVAAVAVGRVMSASEQDQPDVIAGSLLAGGLTLIIPLAGSIAVSAILQGIISLEVARGTVGEKLKASGLFRLARGRIWALIGWSLLVTAAWLIVVAVTALVVTLLIALGGTVGIVVGVLLAVGSFFVLLAAGFWLGTKLSLVPSILMLERLTLGRAIARSWSLTNRSFWKTLGIQLLAQVIVGAATQVITTPVSFVAGIVLGIVAPTDDIGSSLIGLAVTEGVVAIVSLLVGSVTTVMLTATTALIYIDLRMRKEGLDLDLMHFVEARQAGDPSVTDPYLHTPQGA